MGFNSTHAEIVYIFDPPGANDIVGTYGVTVLGSVNQSSPCPDPFAPCVGYDRGGDDLQVIQPYTGNITSCEALCTANSSCMAWTWCGVGSIGPGPRCCLKSAVPAHVDPFEHMACGIAPRAKGRISAGATNFDHGHSVQVGYNHAAKQLSIGKSSVSFKLNPAEGLQLHIYVDSGIIEVVANNRSTLAVAIPISTGNQADGVVSVFGIGAGISAKVDAWSLKNIWLSPP